MKTQNLVSANTLMNVEQALRDGNPKTAPEIAKVIKRDYQTVYKALHLLSNEGKIGCVKNGRFKLFFHKKKEEVGVKHPHVHQVFNIPPPPEDMSQTQVVQIQDAARQYLAKHGPTALVDLVRSLDFPRSSSYAALAEMRRIHGIRVNDEGLLELSAPVLVVPVAQPEPLEGSTTGDLPSVKEEGPYAAPAILAGLVKALTEKALEEALKPLVQSNPEIFKSLLSKPNMDNKGREG